jgi:hypothetical protein
LILHPAQPNLCFIINHFKTIVMAKNISSRMEFLVKFGLLPAAAYDFVFPHGIKLSAATKEYAMAGVVRDIAKKMTDRALQKQLIKAGRSMVDFASAGLINGWEEGDDICPPFFPPIPWPGPWPGGNPEPYPWLTARSEGIDEYANALKVIAGLSAVPAVAEQLNEIAGALGKQF